MPPAPGAEAREVPGPPRHAEGPGSPEAPEAQVAWLRPCGQPPVGSPMSHTVYILQPDYMEAVPVDGPFGLQAYASESDARFEILRQTRDEVDREIVGDEEFDVPPLGPN